MQTQNLQIVPKGVKPIIRASQSDVGRTFQLHLYDGATEYTPPTGTTLRLDGIKPDKTAFSYTDNLTLSGSVITVTCKTQMTLIPGTVQCEIRMTKDSEDIGTINFDLMVEKSPINGTTDLSQTEVPALVALARAEMEDAEAWAAGTKDGVPVGPDDPQYHNNAKYYAQEAGSSATTAGTAATNASSSAQSASTSASAAGTSASNAAAAASRAEAAVVHGPYIGANGNWFVYDFTTQQYTDTNIKAQGPQGPQGIQGLPGEDGTNGTDGVGIVSITKTATQGLVDTYTVLLTNEQTYTFTVTNGQNGTGSGDMLAVNYDPTQAVYNAGGIVAYVASQISGLSTSLSGLTDVALTSLAAGQSLFYDATAQKWVNGSISASNVNYTNATSGLSATKVQAAIDEVAAKNQTLTNNLNDEIEARAKLGAHNLMPLSLEDYKKNNTDGTWSGNTYTIASLDITVNSDLSITLNGTNSREISFYTTKKMSVKSGVKYTISDNVANDSWNTQRIWCQSSQAFPLGNRLSTTDTESMTRTALADETFNVYLQIFANQTYDNVTFYPMICLASDLFTEYTEYAMTNRELTDEVNIKDISSAFYSSLSENVSAVDCAVYKRGKHIFGTVVLNKTNYFVNNDAVLTLSYKPIKTINSFGALSTDRYGGADFNIGSVFINSGNGVITIVPRAENKSYIKFSLDYATND